MKRCSRSQRAAFRIAAFLTAAWLACAGVAGAQPPEDDESVIRTRRGPRPARSSFHTAAGDTVWYGFKASSADPQKVGVGGKWDFDTGIAGTDSTQFWRFLQSQYASDGFVYTTPASRPFWYFDYGNSINAGDHELWKARSAAGRTFVRTGLAGVWHSDDMATVPGSPGNINGTRSAWCGLRYTADPQAPLDELTGNPYTNAEQLDDFRGGSAVRSAFPGYTNLWNQLLYRDFPYTGAAIPLSFRLRTDFGTLVTNDPGGSAWFSPDPTSPNNMVIGPADSLMVWVGKPQETGVYDINRRWLSEVIDFELPGAGQPQKIYAASRRLPANRAAATDTTITTSIPAGAAWGATFRVVFQVHTNRAESDLATSATGFNSLDGAAVIDDVNVGGSISDFEDPLSIRPRGLLGSGGFVRKVDPGTTWITTGRPPAIYGHIHNVFDLPYDDPCGGLDASGTRLCNLTGNILVQSNHDDPGHDFFRESKNWAVSPTIVINETAPRGILQGTPPGLRSDASKLNIEYEYYSGYDDIYVAGTLFWYAVRYMGTGLATLSQIAAPKVANWSPFSTPGYSSSWGSPMCLTQETDSDLCCFIPIAYVDSLQITVENQTRCGRFGATACGDMRGGYWDNVRVGFVRPGVEVEAIATYPWHLLGDTYPFNETVAPGSVGFDTTTALVKDAMNTGTSQGGEGVVPGDTLVCQSDFTLDGARLDLVFRAWPGPGNYSGRDTGGGSQDAWELRHHPLLKAPSAGDVPSNHVTAGDGSWWGAYMADNGEVGSSPSGHTPTYWDPQTWNSARMDSAQHNYFPILSRRIGAPPYHTWMGTYHEDDPKYAALGIVRDLCFLVNPVGPNDHTNTCCSAAQCAAAPFNTTWPPVGYDPLAQTSTLEGTKILPDGLFTPGTHIQYFVRRSLAGNPAVMENMSPDTSWSADALLFQAGMGGYLGGRDQLRYDHVDVLPDLWKDTRFGGGGLACVLYVDATDGWGYEPAVRGALDSLGYGLDSGAERGFKRLREEPPGSGSFTLDFVPENLGQVGLAYDKFDIRAADAGEADRLGCRYVGGSVAPEVAGKQCRQGPTLAMLDYYYNTVLWESGLLDNGSGAMHDCSGVNDEHSCDAWLIDAWLAAAGSGNEKALFLSGDGIAQDLAISGTPSMTALADRVGLVYLQDSYFKASGNRHAGAVFQPLDASPGTADPFHSARRYGFLNSCLDALDIIDANAAVAGAQPAARYEDVSDRAAPGVGAGPYYASVYRRRDPGAGRYYATLIDGFALSRLRTWNGPGDPTTQNYPLTFNNHAQQAWLDDALSAFNLCARVAPVIAVGEQPGLSALNFVRGAMPNPSATGAATVRFSLAQPAKVTIRFYNVAGRLVHEAMVDGRPGENSYRWDGATSTGMRAAAGVYFYRLSAPGVDFQNNGQRMVLLGSSSD